MKKSIALILALVMVLALAACDKNSGGTATYTDDGLVDRLFGICEGRTGEMPVETTSFKRLSDDGFETAGLFANWFNGMEVPEGALVAVNQPMMGQAHVVLLIQPGEGTTADDLLKELTDNANPAWNICMVADTVEYAVKDGIILFLMTDSELGVDVQGILDAFNT